ncbi:hypothetical protein A7U60_g7655 [Sanghuangporus baumii]|uniref:Uncharacterized protein n=1 Tax=Sanghuangporus baumii TaxID=108892 RepID=A0A9Q5HST4_SANBA|nr:hypothetical protein A7U60_g7655 [Sanghuangporus baumii]
MVMDSQGPLDGHPHGPGSTGGGMSGSNKRPYEGSSSESVVSFATDSVSVTQNSVLSGSVANSVVGPDGKRPVKSSVSSMCVSILLYSFPLIQYVLNLLFPRDVRNIEAVVSV